MPNQNNEKQKQNFFDNKPSKIFFFNYRDHSWYDLSQSEIILQCNVAFQ